MSKRRPTTSMCVDEYQSAPVCAPYGLPKCDVARRELLVLQDVADHIVELDVRADANSPTRSLFSSVCV
jgi:hypothetical protein